MQHLDFYFPFPEKKKKHRNTIIALGFIFRSCIFNGGLNTNLLLFFAKNQKLDENFTEDAKDSSMFFGHQNDIVGQIFAGT